MKNKIVSTLLLLLLAANGCATSSRPIEQEIKFSRLQNMQTTAAEEIILLNIKNPVRLGERGSMTIQGQPGVRYTATAVYRHTDRTLTTTKNVIAGPDGLATWTWDTNPKTIPGSYKLVISGGGKMITTAYTVTE